MPCPCRARAVPMPCPCHANSHMPCCVPCPAVSVKVRVVAGKIRTANLLPTPSSNNLRETPPVSRKKPKVGRSPTGRRETADVNSHMPCRSPAALCRGLEKSLSKWHGRGTARARHGMCELNTVALCKSYGNDTI
jgi:hypothetical protein